MRTIIFFILSICFFCHVGVAQTTAIPDTAFEQKLIQLGIDSDGQVNGQILNSDAVGILNLQIHNSSITDLTGIAAFVDLDTLSCHGNNLTSLDVSNNSSLRVLSCSQNDLQSLDLSSNSLLDRLNCSYNNIVNLNISGNPILRYLNCNTNSLVSLDLSTNLSLKSLDCTYNDLTSLNLLNNPNLTHLYCGINKIGSLDFTGNLDLKHVECTSVYLTSLNLNNNLSLTDLYCYESNLTSLDVTNNIALKYLYCYQNQLTSLDVTNNPALTYFYSHDNVPNFRICVQDVQVATTNVEWRKGPFAIYTERCYPKSIEGHLVLDSNQNCLVDSLEQGFAGQIIKFEKVGDTTIVYSTTFDSSGIYVAYLDTGVYTVTVIPSNPYWQACPSSQQVSIDTNYNIQTVNWTLESTVFCPLLEVDISAPFLRMTGGGSFYTVSYCNEGTISAQNAYVEIDLDTDLNFISSTIPLTSQVGNVYTFNIGTVDVGVCNSFDIQVFVDTSAQFEQTHCTEAHIYPDSICVPIWSNSIVDGDVNCQNDTVFFDVDNIGTAMLQPQPYSIFEDNIAMRTGTIQLGAGQSTTIAQPAVAGKTYRIEVDQLAGFPTLLGDAVYSAAIEGCSRLPDNSFNTGFMTQFSNGHASPFIAVDCQQNIASYDPNDKSAQPLGYGSQHYINQNVAIDYKIRFQNTGTDTAFNIAVLDEISPYLDLSTLQMGASSHAYNWEITDGNVLKVSFPNIMLVDSNMNEPLSHGFFRYRIEQVSNNPIGTVINNQAEIYFDYNPVVLTNTTFHTVGENFVISTVSVDKIYEAGLKVTAFPNPFSNSTTIKVEGREYEKLELSIFDITGREVVQKQAYTSGQVQLVRGNLQPGIYVYQLRGDGQLLNVGKIIVK